MQSAGADIPNYHLLASRFSSSGQWDRALETAREWLSREPENRQAHMAAGRALIHLKRHPEAEPHLKKVLAQAPENDSALRLMSMVHFHQKRFEAADEAIQKALARNPNDPNHWHHLAWMLYKQGDPRSALKYAERARELSPRDADILNLVALCQPRHAGDPARVLRQYRDALEINPQNATVHNNIGVHYLNVEKNFGAAEDAFRRALFFDPTLQVAKSNLFITIKHRDRVYRALCAPRDFLLEGAALFSKNRRKNFLLYFLMLPLWILAFRFVLAGLALWFFFVWPLVKAYEYLTIGDIRTAAGEIGARRGGLFGYRRWALKWRLFLFGLLLVVFWGGVAVLCEQKGVFADKDKADVALGTIAICGLALWIGFWLKGMAKRGQFRLLSRTKQRKIDALMQPGAAPMNTRRTHE